MPNFLGKNLLSVQQLDRDAIASLFDVTSTMQMYARRKKRTNVLQGAVLSNLFFEPSTRTRLSFGSAFNLLGGQVQDIVDSAQSSLSKGESLYDCAKMIDHYSDVAVIRHPQEGSALTFANACDIPVINGGDGSHQHPTQALLDLYTIEQELSKKEKSIDGLHIALVGDLKYSRTIHSLIELLCHYNHVRFTLIAPPELPLGETWLNAIEKAKHSFIMQQHFDDALNDVDIIYVTRIQEERFPNLEQAKQAQGKLTLNRKIYETYATSGASILHPLPRHAGAHANELDQDLNTHPNLAIFRQAQHGLALRMALFAMILGVENQVHRYQQSVTWHTTKSNYFQ